MTYEVEVSRDGGVWVADVEHLTGTQIWAEDLATLWRKVGVAIQVAEGLAETASVPTSLTYADVPASVRVAVGLGRAAKSRQEHPVEHLHEVVREVARQLAGDGIAKADIAALLGLSPARLPEIL